MFFLKEKHNLNKSNYGPDSQGSRSGSAERGLRKKYKLKFSKVLFLQLVSHTTDAKSFKSPRPASQRAGQRRCFGGGRAGPWAPESPVTTPLSRRPQQGTSGPKQDREAPARVAPRLAAAPSRALRLRFGAGRPACLSAVKPPTADAPGPSDPPAQEAREGGGGRAALPRPPPGPPALGRATPPGHGLSTHVPASGRSFSVKLKISWKLLFLAPWTRLASSSLFRPAGALVT